MKDDLILIKNFSIVSEAEMMKNLLEKFGIMSLIQRGNVGAATEFSGKAGDADLFVLKKDYEKAIEILKDTN